jgi:hypothetical protein
MILAYKITLLDVVFLNRIQMDYALEVQIQQQ